MGEREDGGEGGGSDRRPAPSLSPVPPLVLSPNLNHLWAGLLVEELVRQGVGLFVVAPGSRSGPLAAAVAANPRARHVVHYDERGGAFCALGWARAAGRPAAWITTSGTAVANGLPAAVEAAADGVPLLLLTADRPPELRETGANQTIRQPGLFGGFVRWSFDLPTPSDDVDPAFVLTTAAQAVRRSLAPPGPVHLNLPFREPLAPTPNRSGAAPLLTPYADWLASGRPYTRYATSPPAVVLEEIEELAERLEGVERGLVVLGKIDDPATAPAAARLAAALGWPLLPDVASGGRLGAPAATAVPFFDLALASERFREGYRPEAVLHLGRRATSKRLQEYVESARPAFYGVVRPDPERFDPGHVVTDRLQSDVAGLCRALAYELVPASGRSDWLETWQAASGAVARALDAHFDEDDGLSEPRVARFVSALIPGGHGLVAAASMPVRDLDAFAVARGAALRVTANRGASGIDGTVATAAGFARGLGRSTTLLVGDLALLHDLNSLALLRTGPPVAVVVLNNDGGGIFSFLPIAEYAEGHGVGEGDFGFFEPFFGAPHGLHFEAAARLFGLAYVRPETPGAFEAAYREALASGASAVIEVRTDRRENAALHRAITARAARAVGEALGL